MLIRCRHKSTSNQHQISIFKFKLNYVDSIFNYDIVNISNQYRIDVALEPQVSVKDIGVSKTASYDNTNNDNYRLFDKKLKCLFLRSQHPLRSALQQLVYKIFNLASFKKEAEKLVQDASKKFTDYRNKFNEAIILLVKDMQGTNREFSDHEVNEYISEEVVVKKIL
ncbi:hypothetical protein GLOIN_2v1571258 [Rhizophagus clarus]|uniref:Uncharacterized protein n=1 Tax=Rhizophagus clarus TaxID=94130 RepID=A0A8H3KV07_9GLOM|nr:hypothetical protein GLOIN_2v1571258 [Rhizophagus clarus]